jgi:medium-chain acyl-[acyl-carrier-protein] hydrolase
MVDLVEAITAALRPLLDRPFACFGHSMGALVAHELALHLRREFGLEPIHLFVSGRRAPHLRDQVPAIHGLPDPAFVEALMLRYGGIPDVIIRDPELLRLFLPTIRADLALIETYTWQESVPLACPVSAYGGSEDPWATPDLLAPWSERTTGRFAQEIFPGNHFYLHSARDLLLGALSKELSSSLRQAEKVLSHVGT